MQQAFDSIAKNYDVSFTFSEIGKAQREIIWNYIEQAIPQQKKISVLELNCGTGEDALWFAKKGHKVLATDVSTKMLNMANEKIEAVDMRSFIKTMNVDLTKIQAYHFEEKFDLIFSNFGGMNCISSIEMKRLPEELSKLNNYDGRLIMVIMPKYCLWETLYFLFKLNFKDAFRRFSDNGAIAKMNGMEVRTNYYTPKEIRKMFGKYFNVVAIKPIGFVIPPSYLGKFFSTKKKTFNFLKGIEKYFSNQSYLSAFSDHFLIDLQIKK